MSFFFTKAKKEPKRLLPARPKAASQGSKEMLNRLGCKACPLNHVNNHHPKMQPDLADKTDVYILGDIITKVDDEKGSFKSPDNHILFDILDSNVHRTSFDYVIRDYDPVRKQPPWVAMECCRSYVTKSIEDAKPKVIIGLGVLPLQWVLNSTDIGGLRGRVFSVKVGNHPCYFICTHNPYHVYQQAWDPERPLRSLLGHCLMFDVRRAFEAAKWDPPVIDAPESVRAGIQTFSGQSAGDLAAVLKLLGLAANAQTKAIDLETSALRPYGKNATLLTVALSYNHTNFSFALDHPKAGWTTEQKKQLKDALRTVLASDGRIVAHNAPFECEWLVAILGKRAIFHDAWECTMMQAHFLDERRGRRGGHDDQFAPNPYQALDFLIKQYFGLSYKHMFKLNRKNMLEADLEETLIYNAADTKYTLKLYKLQTFLLKERGLYEAYKEAADRQPTVALMQSFGLNIDQERNQQGRDGLGAVLSIINDEIHTTPEVLQYEKDTKQEFNPSSQPELLRVLKDYLKVGKALVNAVGKETTDKGALAKITHPLAKLVEDYRNCGKLKSTYFDQFKLGEGRLIYPDARIHPTFNTTFAETGRTSSNEPNAQNWPSRQDKWARSQIVAPKGHVIVAFDYGQLEACTAAMCSQDKVLVDALWNDYDIHMEWAIKAANLFPDFIGGLANLKDKAIMKTWRGRIKNKLVFPVFFGAKTSSVNGYLRIATGLDVPTKITDELMEEFWDTFHGVYRWQKKLMTDYYSIGYVQSPTGRRHHYPLRMNQAVNFPIQSVACDIMCRAMVDLSKLATDTGQWYLHPIMTIHDDLSFIIPDKDKILDEAIETIAKIMVHPPYSFVNVPMSVAASVGNDWANMQDAGKFWSNK